MIGKTIADTRDIHSVVCEVNCAMKRAISILSLDVLLDFRSLTRQMRLWQKQQEGRVAIA